MVYRFIGMKKILIIVATLLWMGYWWWWYTCKICTTCTCHKNEVIAPPTIIPESGLLLFSKNDTIGITQPGWAAFRDSLILSLLPQQGLLIEGQYTSTETNPSHYENLGLARAAYIRMLFPDSLSSRIRISSLLTDERPTMIDHPFVAHNFIIETISDKIESIGDKTIVYFNYNSNQRIKDKEIEDYLSKLADKNKNTRTAFIITGHTDNTGTSVVNQKLGLKRAEAIKNYLIHKGIAANRITTLSKGDQVPIADNTTAVGRKKNRRTEIELVNKQ